MPPRFENPWPGPRRGLREVLRWKLGLGDRVAASFPEATNPAAVRTPGREELQAMPGRGWKVTWLGHASFLLSGGGCHVLIDPVFSDHCSPLPLPGFRRLVPVPCGIGDLPEISAVLLTHSHYDHCDLPTLRMLGRRTRLVVPEGHGAWLRRKGFVNLTEVPWWSEAGLAPGVVATAVPARHFTARTPWDRNRGHWCGWVLAGGGASVWHSGDTGWMPGFAEIGARLGPIDLGLVGIGAYAPRWFMEPLHMNPAEAVRAACDARCRRAIGMHWGTFRLSDEPMGEPPLLLAAALREAGLPEEYFTTGGVGEQWQTNEGHDRRDLIGI